MDNIDELIEYHKEGVSLDFKLEEYKKPKKYELVKDVLAMANAHYEGDKIIIIGIKKSIDGNIKIVSVDNPEDPASIQQYVINNIKPDLDIEYYPYSYKGNTLMILRIKNPLDRPYAIKKTIAYDGGGIFMKPDAMVIRKGEHCLDMTRDDLEKIYTKKLNQKPSLEGKVKVHFDDTDKPITQLASIPEDFALPSEIEREKIHSKVINLENTLHEEKNNKIKNQRYSSEFSMNIHLIVLERKRKELLSVKSDYALLDKWFLSEKHSHKIQFNIYNGGDYALRNGTFIIQIPPFDGLNIPTEIVRKHNLDMINPQDLINYPKISTNAEGVTLISASVGDIKHKLKHELLYVPLRMYFNNSLVGTTIKMHCTLHADNLPDPLKYELEIEVI